MKDIVKIVDLNEFEQKNTLKIVEQIRRVGKGYRRQYPAGEGEVLRFSVEEASDSRVTVNGAFGESRFKFIVKGDHVIFSTTNSMWPEALFYDFVRILALEIKELQEALDPDLKIMDTFSANINDYYLVNNGYQEKISEAFRRFISRQNGKEYVTGKFFICVGSASFGEEPLRRLSRAFAESSLFEDVAFAIVSYRGRSVPVFFAEGGIYYLLAERDFYETFQMDFARIFTKASGKRLDPVFDLEINGTHESPNSKMPI